MMPIMANILVVPLIVTKLLPIQISAAIAIVLVRFTKSIIPFKYAVAHSSVCFFASAYLIFLILLIFVNHTLKEDFATL